MKETRINTREFINKFLGIVIFTILISAISFGQAVKPDKNAAMIKQMEAKLKVEKAKLAKAERAAAISDSLIEVGTKMQDESETEFNEMDQETSAMDKEYNANIKPLQKKMNSKDKDVAMEATKEFKTIDIKYKADQKASLAKQKAIEKKATTGKLNVDKGKASKKMTAEALKNAQASVDALEQKIEALKSGDEDAGNTKGKKKK